MATDTEFDCLIRNVYYEAKSEPHKGKLAVALVTLNRADSHKYPNTICGVVYQKNQFSWTKVKRLEQVNPVQWQAAKDAAFEAYMNRNILGSFKATHFHATHVFPGWKLHKLAKIGNHVFYM